MCEVLPDEGQRGSRSREKQGGLVAVTTHDGQSAAPTTPVCRERQDMCDAEMSPFQFLNYYVVQFYGIDVYPLLCHLCTWNCALRQLRINITISWSCLPIDHLLANDTASKPAGGIVRLRRTLKFCACWTHFSVHAREHHCAVFILNRLIGVPPSVCGGVFIVSARYDVMHV